MAAWWFAAAFVRPDILAADQRLFSLRTIPDDETLRTDLSARRTGAEWVISVSVTNSGTTPRSFRLALAAEPHLRADSYLMPGINYDGNPYGKNVPKGWELNGEPWIFSYDRGSIPSCTISENADTVFALYASDGDEASMVSACSMEKLEDGSFRHLIYWPVVEAPLTYSGKQKFTERYDTWLTLAPGQSFAAKAYACTGKPEWPHYGFAAVFPLAWKNLKHDTPACRTVEETMKLDWAFQKWCRRQNAQGYWFGSIIDDRVFCAGYYKEGKSSDGYTIEDYEKNPSLNRWNTDEIEQSKHLKDGEYCQGAGRDLGFGAQSFQMARLAIEHGLRHNIPDDIDFGKKVLESWIRVRQLPSGIFKGYKDHPYTVRDASNTGWAVIELARTCRLLRLNGMDDTLFDEAGRKLVRTILAGVGTDGSLGSMWNCSDGSVSTREGDSGGYVLLGLVRWWQLTRDRQLTDVIDKAFDFYYKKDIDNFRCNGGAMDCQSVDREGIHPFLTAAMQMYRETGNNKYLTYAEKAAWYFLSWLYLQNPVYGPETDFAIRNYHPAGATIVGAEHPALDEYACVLIPDFIALSKVKGNPLWKEVASLIWCNATQGFADEHNRIWHNLERPYGSKNEAFFPSRWNKYRTGDGMRGFINDHLTAWAGTYRLSSLYDLAPEDLLWLAETCRP